MAVGCKLTKGLSLRFDLGLQVERGVGAWSWSFVYHHTLWVSHEIRCTFLGPHSEDCRNLGLFWGPTILGNLQICFHMHAHLHGALKVESLHLHQDWLDQLAVGPDS